MSSMAVKLVHLTSQSGLSTCLAFARQVYKLATLRL